MSKRRPTPARSSTWGEWFHSHDLPNGEEVWGNGLFTVTVAFADPERRWTGAVHLSLHDRKRTTRHDWREFQRIKSELCGEEREAVELYPAESRLIDGSNEYHLWVAPDGEQIAVGFDSGRQVIDRDWTPDPEQLAALADENGMTPARMAARLRKARQRRLS